MDFKNKYVYDINESHFLTIALIIPNNLCLYAQYALCKHEFVPNSILILMKFGLM